MKRKLAPLLVFVTLTVNAQLSDVVIGLNNPGGLVLYEDTLFIGVLNDKKISSIDITAIAPVPQDIIDSLTGSPLAMLINGNDMYIAENNAGIISKIDLRSDSSTATNMLIGLSAPGGLALHNNDLYYSEFGANKISKIDITDSIATPVEVVTGLSKPGGLVLHGNDLYIAEFGLNKISKIDITDTSPIPVDVATGILGPIAMLLHGDDLFMTEYANGFIVKIDITIDNPTRIEVIGGLINPNGIAIDSIDLYIAERGADKISKFTFDVTALSEMVKANLTEIYPNPASDYVKFNNLNEDTMIEIFSVSGEKIEERLYKVESRLDIRELTRGIYFIRISGSNNAGVHKLVKH